VTTELQRLMLPAGTRVLVAIHGRAALDENGGWDERCLHGLSAALAQVEDKAGHVEFSVYFTTREMQSLDWSRQGFREARLRQFALSAGFRDARVRHRVSHPGLQWQDWLAAGEPRAGDAPDQGEDGLGDDRATAFAVRTPLSRFLAGGADCVVDVPRLSRGGEIDASLKRSIESSIAQVELPQKDLLLLRARLADPRSDTPRLRDQLEVLRESLGFRESQIRGVLNRR
jgi:hypothetical protein